MKSQNYLFVSFVEQCLLIQLRFLNSKRLIVRMLHRFWSNLDDNLIKYLSLFIFFMRNVLYLHIYSSLLVMCLFL